MMTEPTICVKCQHIVRDFAPALYKCKANPCKEKLDFVTGETKKPEFKYQFCSNCNRGNCPWFHPIKED